MAKDYFSDFSPKCMSFGGAFLSLSIAIFTYILLPLSGISLLTAIGPEITAAMGEDTIDFSMLLDQIAMYLRNLMVYSIPLIVLSIFVGLYEKGSYARIPFKFVSCLYLAVVLLMFTKGGMLDLTIDGSTLGPEIGDIVIVLEIKAFIYILAIISALKGFLAFAEFSDNRKKYLERSAKKFNKKDKKRAKWFVYEDSDETPRKKKKKKKVEEDDEYYDEE